MAATLDLRPCASVEEIGTVVAYWNSIRRALGNPGTPSLPAPPQDVLTRVAVHQRWEAAMLCTHERGVSIDMDGMRCSDCDRPMRFMSDVQIADLKK